MRQPLLLQPLHLQLPSKLDFEETSEFRMFLSIKPPNFPEPASLISSLPTGTLGGFVCYHPKSGWREGELWRHEGTLELENKEA